MNTIMWEQIQSNKRKSVMLVLAMALILLTLGFVIGQALYLNTGGRFGGEQGLRPSDFLGGYIGMAVGAALWFTLALTAYFGGNRVLLAVAGARPVEKEDCPRLYNVVEEMAIAAGLATMPRIYLVDSMGLNAFAAGRSPENASISVTLGLLNTLNRDQLQGVVAHEMSHIINRDVLFMQMVGVMVGTIAMMSEVFLRSMFFTSRYSGRSRSSRRGGGGGGGAAALIFIVLGVILAILSPILAHIIYFSTSRRREYLADANAAVLTRYPAGLAEALEVIAGDSPERMEIKKSLAPMYISNPNALRASSPFSTHPPIHERIRILRSIGGNISYNSYQKAWGQVAQGRAGKLPASSLAEGREFAARKPHTEAAKAPQDRRKRFREAGDALRSANRFVFLPCVCGLKVKLPPDMNRDKVNCPRCGRELTVPVAAVLGMEQVADALEQHADSDISASPAEAARKPQPPLQVVRRGSGWMTFECSCGAERSLSPSYSGKRLNCGRCGREIHIKSIA